MSFPNFLVAAAALCCVILGPAACKSDSPTEPDAPVLFASVSAGLGHNCALTGDGTAYCWGDNEYWQLGDGSNEPRRALPVKVKTDLEFATISAGLYHTCAVTAGGKAYCWGENRSGSLGAGNLEPSNTPVAVQGGLVFTQLSTGNDATCGVTSATAVYCWGDNRFGQLGNPPLETCLGFACSTTPVQVPASQGFVEIAVGHDWACALDDTGAAFCWGANEFGQLGNGTRTQATTPQRVLGGLSFSRIAAGLRHACGVTLGGDAHCWGDDGGRQLGTTASIPQCDNTECTTSPVPVTGGLNFESIAAGSFHTCALAEGRSAFCWGKGDSGEIGDGRSAASNPAPVLVAGGFRFVQLSVGAFRACAISTNGNTYCWGGAGGDLGDGKSIPSPVPSLVLQPERRR